MMLIPAQYHVQTGPWVFEGGSPFVLTGIVLSAVAAGWLGAAVSILSGNPPAVSLLFYSLAGCCGVLAFIWQALSAARRA